MPPSEFRATKMQQRIACELIVFNRPSGIARRIDLLTVGPFFRHCRHHRGSVKAKHIDSFLDQTCRHAELIMRLGRQRDHELRIIFRNKVEPSRTGAAGFRKDFAWCHHRNPGLSDALPLRILLMVTPLSLKNFATDWPSMALMFQLWTWVSPPPAPPCHPALSAAVTTRSPWCRYASPSRGTHEVPTA